MNNIADLEKTILYCFLLKPELIEHTILNNENFVHYKNIFVFMKSFYKKFKNFDFILMCSVCKNKYKLMQYITDILDTEANPNNFKLYEKQFIDLYNESEKEQWLINKIHENFCDLQVRNINTKEFKNKINQLYENADKIFKK